MNEGGKSGVGIEGMEEDGFVREVVRERAKPKEYFPLGSVLLRCLHGLTRSRFAGNSRTARRSRVKWREMLKEGEFGARPTS